ncbi:AMP-binding protein [Candidatus Amarolinea aalborgensis]|uniref:AMP-binding protein n=1 Tax=Candidatus Amarolinea aalborgensis TaxID=2249329 RepID=UPI003BFA1BC4
MADLDFFHVTIGDLLTAQAARYAEREALVHLDQGVRLTYAQLAAACDQAACGLMALGVNKGDHVGLWAPNDAAWAIVQLAAAQIGAILVTINPHYRLHELSYILRHAQVNELIVKGSPKYLNVLHELIPELRRQHPGTLDWDALPHLRHIVTLGQEPQPGLWSWDDVEQLGAAVSPEALAARRAACHPDDVMNIQFTSGTTGVPKGAMLTHRNLVSNAILVTDCLALAPDDRLCLPVPFFHCFGCVMGTLGCLVRGAALIVPGDYFDAFNTLRAIEQERCTAIYGVPAMFIAELSDARLPSFDLTSLRTGIMAGSPCPIALTRRVVAEMGVRELTIAYGLTEASPIVTQTRVTDPPVRRITTVGKPLPGVEVRLVDPVSRQDVAVGGYGELWTRSPMVMPGYFAMPDATADAVDADGWLHTGDLAMIDRDGYYHITGRMRDMIIRGGENIYPREIEDFLDTHPKIAQVQVIGVPDLKYGEEVMAWIQLRAGESATVDEIRSFCRGQIANYKIPRYIRFVSDFPSTATGKIRKNVMREMAIAELGLQALEAIETA